MNEQTNEIPEEIDENIKILINDLIDQIENNSLSNEESSNQNELIHINFDTNLLNELLTKKLTFSEYLSLLDRLIDNKFLHLPLKTSDDLFNDIHLLAEQIEQYRTIIITDYSNDTDLDAQIQLQNLSNTQSNYSVISFLQQSISMDMSQLNSNDLSNQIQSTIFTNSIITSTSINTTKPADIGMIFFFILNTKFS